MTYHAAETKAGPALFVAAASAVASSVFATLYLVSFLCSGLGVALIRDVGSVSLIGLIVAAPIALMVRCTACDRLLIPLVYNGKSSSSLRSPNAWVIAKTAFMVVLHRRAPCPHCGTEAEV
jgi:hypothetical protein